MNMDRGPCLGLGVDGDLRAGAHREASVQLQIDQHGAGGGQLCGQQVDLHVREEVRAVGLDPILAECCLDGLGHEIGAAAVDVFRQRVDCRCVWWWWPWSRSGSPVQGGALIRDSHLWQV